MKKDKHGNLIDHSAWPKHIREHIVGEPEYVGKVDENDTNLKNVFLMNCAASVETVHYHGLVDDKIRAWARRAADAWSKLADEMEKD